MFGMKNVNAYLFLDPAPILVDCGEQTEASWQALRKALKNQGLSPSDIQKIIITHAHVDHIGMAGQLCEINNAEVWIPDYAKDWVYDLENMRKRRTRLIIQTFDEFQVPQNSYIRDVFSQIFTSFQKAWGPIPAANIHTYTEGDQIALGKNTWEVIHTPGHCINQCCFFEPRERQLISADMLLPITPSPVIEANLMPPYNRTKSLPQMLQSYEKVKNLSPKIVYPGHGLPFENAKDVIAQQVARIHKRKNECLDHLKGGNLSVFEIFKRMYGKNIVGWPMLLGYLDLLESEGYIFQDEDNHFIIIS